MRNEILGHPKRGDFAAKSEQRASVGTQQFKAGIAAFLTGALLLTLLNGTSSVGASLAYEGFDYPPATPLTGQNGGSGFAVPWTADPGVIVQPPGLATPLGLPSTGLSVGGGFNGARQLASPLNQPEFWVSLQIQANPGNDQVYLGLDLGPSPMPLVSFGRILNSYFIRQGSALPLKGGIASPVGATDLLVARFRQLGGFTLVELWVNTIDFTLPPLLSMGVPTISYTWANLQVQPGLFADEVRIGTAPADVAASAGGGGSTTLNYSVDRNHLTLRWDQGTLLQADTINGPWSAVEASSPYTVPLTAPQQFYRVLVR